MEIMEIKEYFLKPGELLFSKVPAIVKTILGSCVSVCIFDNKQKFAGICHYLLPDSAGNSA
ncbi:MAG: chemotaxis protein CheD, partial [Brevinematales bacterium]